MLKEAIVKLSDAGVRDCVAFVRGVVFHHLAERSDRIDFDCPV